MFDSLREALDWLAAYAERTVPSAHYVAQCHLHGHIPVFADPDLAHDLASCLPHDPMERFLVAEKLNDRRHDICSFRAATGETWTPERISSTMTRAWDETAKRMTRLGLIFSR